MIKSAIRTKKSFCQTNLLHLRQISVSAFSNNSNIKCKRPDIDAIYRYVTKTVVTNVERDFTETTVEEVVNKNIIFNKRTVQGLDSYFIVNCKKNLDITNPAFANENVNSN